MLVALSRCKSTHVQAKRLFQDESAAPAYLLKIYLLVHSTVSVCSSKFPNTRSSQVQTLNENNLLTDNYVQRRCFKSIVGLKTMSIVKGGKKNDVIENGKSILHTIFSISEKERKLAYLIELNYVRMVQHFQYLHLPVNFLQVRVVQLFLVDHFYGHL